jgi:hypothetical protein
VDAAGDEGNEMWNEVGMVSYGAIPETKFDPEIQKRKDKILVWCILRVQSLARESYPKKFTMAGTKSEALWLMVDHMAILMVV